MEISCSGQSFWQVGWDPIYRRHSIHGSRSWWWLNPPGSIHWLPSLAQSRWANECLSLLPCHVRGDEGQNIYVGDESNVQDGVVIHGLETFESGEELFTNEVEVNGIKFSVYVGKRVSLSHQSLVHGPARIGDDTFVGMQALVFRSELGDRVVVEPGAKIIGVKIASDRYVPALSIVTKQIEADALPHITDEYPYKNLNQAVVHVNTQLADPRHSKQTAKLR